MRWLAIETSTARGTVALIEDGAVCREEVFVAERGHNAAIFAPLERMLEGAAAGLDGIVVGTGPGSYGGVRVGIAVATGLSLAKGAVVVGVPSLLGAAWAEADDYVVVGDARRGSFFVAEVAGRRLVGEPALVEGAAFVDRVEALTGAGRVVLTFDERVLPGKDGQIVAAHPSAGVLGTVTAEMSEAERLEMAEAALQPIYLRAPYITKPKA
jgi:tRNA threonylcarbamoyladenosine biosynthesis protein TsaB